MTMGAAGGRTLHAIQQISGLTQVRSGVTEYRDRRRTPRFEPSAGPYEVLVHRHGDRAIRALLGDISITGARLVADERPRIGERLEVVIAIGRCLHVYTADVLYVGDCGEMPEIGVRFLSAPRRVGRPEMNGVEVAGAA